MRSGARVELVVQRAQPVRVDVRVDLRRRDIAVAEHHLHRAQVGAVLEKVRREAVPQHVRRQRADAGAAAVAYEDLPEPLPRHRRAAVVQEHLRVAAAQQPAAHLGEIAPHPRLRLLPHRHDALLAALAEGDEEALVETQLRERPAYQLRYSQAGRVEALQLLPAALDDLVDPLLGLARGERLLALHGALAGEHVLGDLLAAHEARVGGGDVHGDVAHQLLEVVGAGDEGGLAVDLDEHADLAAGVDVGADGPLGGDAAGLLGGARQPLRAQHVDRLLDVALALEEGVLAVHHAGAGALAKLLDHLRCDAHLLTSHRRAGARPVVVALFATRTLDTTRASHPRAGGRTP